MNNQPDLERMRKEYDSRMARKSLKGLYSNFNQSALFATQRRQRWTLGLLKKYGFSEIELLNILEVGCGTGGVLTEYLGFGATPGNIFGVDFLFDRLLYAHHRLPGSGFANADGQFLPFVSHTFDLVLQYTAVSSILNSDIRRNICADMIRVLKPGGIILWYDFWLNPSNPQTHGIKNREIRSLFRNCRFEFNKITLAPPIARLVVPISWGLAMFLENFQIFNSHYLVAIIPLN